MSAPGYKAAYGQTRTGSSVWIIFAIISMIITACNGAPVAGTTSPALTPLVETQENTPANPTTPAPMESPTPTSVPLAATVNGFEITIADFQSELALYKAALGSDLTAGDEERVLNNLVDQTLLAQAASESGFIVSDDLLEERIKFLAEQLGGQEALSNWMNEYQYDERGFRAALARAIASAWMRDQIIADVPTTAEHVRAVQILLYEADEADEVMAQLQAGNDFGNLALTYDPITSGDLGWFPRGYLPDTQLEEAAFALAPGEYTPVIRTLAGFHILMVLERDPQHTLAPEAYRSSQSQALESWLDTRRTDSNIHIMLP